MKRFRSNSTNELLRALQDPSIDIDQLIDIAWREYCKAGSPCGQTTQGLVLWLEARTWATSN